MNEVETYILEKEGSQKEMLLYFHFLFVERFGLQPKIRFKIPMYYKNKWLTYLNPNKKGGVELSFINGFKLSNRQNLLESKGRKMVRSITFECLEEIQERLICEILEEAIEIDEN